MLCPFIKDIVNALSEKNYKIAIAQLEKINGLDNYIPQNFFSHIIDEELLCVPKESPFYIAMLMWNNINSESIKQILQDILGYPIANINKAKINDFLWVATHDFIFAKEAEKFYRIHIENTEGFDLNFTAIIRLVDISKHIKSTDINELRRSELIKRVLNQYDNEKNNDALYLIKLAIKENVEVDYLLQYTEKILSIYDEQSCEYDIIEEFCDVLEQLYYKKNKWQEKKCVTESKIIEIRRRKIKAIQMAAERDINNDDSGNLMRSIILLKNVVKILKTITNTEAERKDLLKKIDELEKKSLSNMHTFSSKQDVTEIVQKINKELECLDKEEILYYLALHISLPDKNMVEKCVIEQADSLSGLFTSVVLGNDGKPIAMTKPIKKSNGEIDSVALQNSMEQKATEYMNISSQVFIQNTLHYIFSKFEIEEKDIRKIIENSYIVDENRRESCIKGIMAGFKNDFMTALHILIPQAENFIRIIAKMCDEVVYNLNEDGLEELKTMHAILELDGVKEHLDEDFLLSLKTVFCSKYGFNMRNCIAHGLFSDDQSQSYVALYTWWFIFRMCYMFCKKLEIENRIKVSDKLRKLQEENAK